MVNNGLGADTGLGADPGLGADGADGAKSCLTAASSNMYLLRRARGRSPTLRTT